MRRLPFYFTSDVRHTERMLCVQLADIAGAGASNDFKKHIPMVQCRGLKCNGGISA